MNEEMKKKQIEAIKKIRRQFADEEYWCLENWLDALDERSSGDEPPSDQNRYAQPEAVQTLLPRGAFGKTV